MAPWGDGYGERPDGLTLESLQHDHPHGIDFGPMVAARSTSILRTASGDVELAHDNILGDLPRLRERASPSRRSGLVLIGRRHVRSNNSWMHNVDGAGEGQGPLHAARPPRRRRAARARRRRSVARVTSEAGSVEVVVEISDEIRRGVVSLPHGWGHDRPGTRLSVASERPGVNTNVLAPGHFVDVPSGNAAVNGIPVDVVPA